MCNVRVEIAYDGTKYNGWQIQKSTELTIQGKLQTVLTRLVGKEIEVIGSGRTDAGVHARKQVANFHMDNVEKILSENDCMNLDDFVKLVNSYLPEDIAIMNATFADERFHARYAAKSKTYRYRIHISPIPNVFERKYIYTYLDRTLDVELMQLAAKKLLGKQDFKSFCGNKRMKKSTVRTIFDIRFECSENEICIYYTGDGFLQNMVRILTGTLIEIGAGLKQISDLDEIIQSKNRELAGFTAPAKGLCLYEVMY